MKILKITIYLRAILLIIICIPLVQNKFYVEAGVLALFALSSLHKLRISDIEKRLANLEGKNNEK